MVLTTASESGGGRALEELAAVLADSGGAVERLCEEILAADRVFVYGVGREGLMMRALCMRLAHLGLAAHVVGEMTTPAIGRGDLLALSAGPGSFETVAALQRIAAASGARTLVVTAQPDAAVPAAADAVVVLPAQTMADDLSAPGALPMGSAFEIAELIVFDLASIRLRELTGQTPEQMRDRHTNLE